MGYFKTIDWNGIKKDLQKGMEKGVVAVRKGAMVVKKKAGELGDESKRQYQAMTIKSKVHTAISDLGARVYAVMTASRPKNPAQDARVKDLVVQIKKLDAQIAALDSKQAGAPKQSKRPKRTTKKR